LNADPAWPRGYALKEFDVIDSTNEEARRMAASGEAGPIWITADRQSAGRGRRGRAWESPSGNLSATLLLRPARPPNEGAQLSFVAALAAAEAIKAFAPSARIAVKWPNDVLADGRKIAGILLESASTAGGRLAWLAVGIGANLARHPEGMEFPATSLAELGERVPPARDVLLHLAAGWAKWYEIWTLRGFGEIRDAWIARAAGMGTRIRARLQNEETSGVFEGIDDTGALLLREAQDRVRAIAAGEVFF
jgi:BirA family transcriptional regulator, biotin operon repressor / biotin---[acetyl-CoA-carboxylase] ligase